MGVRPNEDGVGLVRAVKPCAFGAPLHGFGAWPRARPHAGGASVRTKAQTGTPAQFRNRGAPALTITGEGSRAALTLDRGPPHVRGASIDPPGYDAQKDQGQEASHSRRHAGLLMHAIV